MTKDIIFIKEEDKWFAHLPDYIEQGGTKDDCEMVAGADFWLDMISEQEQQIKLRISDDTPLNESIKLYDSDEYGATYVAHTYKNEDINHILWLCSVTLHVFGKYPNTIYYQRIKMFI